MSTKNTAAASPPDNGLRGYQITDNNVVQIDASVVDTSTTHISFGGYSTAGLKSENQDAFAVLQPEVAVRKYKGSVAAIADGVSSSARSQEASQLSVTDFISDYYSTPDTWEVKDSAARVLNALNSWLYQHGNQGPVQSSELVTTFSAIILKSHTAHIFHAGDSRIYCYRGEKLEQLTRDHSRREANNNMVLTNALGMGTHLEVDYLQHELRTGDIFLMSTDGVHDFLSDRELEEFLAEDTAYLEPLAQRISNTALSRGSDDNLSALLLKVQSLPRGKKLEAQRSTDNYVIPPTLEAGMTIDGFHVLEILPGGKQCHRYLVSTEGDRALMVLKTPCLDYAQDSDYLETFIREQWIAQRLDHPRISRIHPRPVNSSFIYNVYEYTPSQTLRQWMHDNPEPAIATVRGIVEQIASALRAFQRKGMMHRDLTPDNVLIDRDGQVKLSDFGTAQLSGLKSIKDPSSNRLQQVYGAPEYLAGQSGAFRSDIFSLGVLSYEMLCGERPFKPTTLTAKKTAHGAYRSIQLVRENIPVWIDAALKKATAPAPDKRYQALSELCHDLSTPNQTLVDKFQNSPLMDRHPLLIWQLFSLLLFVLLLWVAV